MSPLGNHRHLLTVDDPWAAATTFNWLIMAEPVNRAMLLGDDVIPDQRALRQYAEEGVHLFLSLYSIR